MSLHYKKYLVNSRKLIRRKAKCELWIYKWRVERRDIFKIIRSVKWDIWDILLVQYNVWVIIEQEGRPGDKLPGHDAFPEVLPSV